MSAPARRWLLALAFALLGLQAAPARAHKASDAYLSLTVQGPRVEERLDIALRDLDRDLVLDANDDGRITWGELRSRWGELQVLTQATVDFQADGLRCEADPTAAAAAVPPQIDEHSDGRYAVLRRYWLCTAPVQRLVLAYHLFASTDPQHRGIVRVVQAGNTQTAVLGPDAPTQAFVLQATAAAAAAGPVSALGFVHAGVHHILVGIDHVLFLMALLLPAVLLPAVLLPAAGVAGLRPVCLDVLRVVTAFTVAHSITLALAVLGILNPPSRWVESIIAASVFVAALNNLYPVVRKSRWALTFAFGLVHGFGFASALQDLGLAGRALVFPLLGFNLGVELGQLAIVVLFLPLAWRLRATHVYRTGVMGGGSVLIALLALVWLVERGFDVSLMPDLWNLLSLG